jgi:glycosyltransferase involved in cell wall biosynthesis
MSVIIPAHNERATIGRLLRLLIDGDDLGRLEIIVAVNGSSDGTAEAARAVSDRVKVLELETASKTAALNLGDRHATAFPRAYVDADVTVTAGALLALADALADPDAPRVAAPRFRVDTAEASWPARQYFAVWALSEYNVSGHVGSGIYALSQAGRSRFASFPDIIADDLFVQRLFAPEERVVLAEHEFMVAAPRTLRAQLSRAIRLHAGIEELNALGVTDRSASRSAGHARLVKRVAARPGLWAALAVYSYGYLLPRAAARRLRASGRAIGWHQDTTNRRLPA